MERKNVFKHIFQVYILPKGKQSMISMMGYNIKIPFGKGREISCHYPNNGVWIIDKYNLTLGFKCSY